MEEQHQRMQQYQYECSAIDFVSFQLCFQTLTCYGDRVGKRSNKDLNFFSSVAIMSLSTSEVTGK